jgi:hypothetical protein
MSNAPVKSAKSSTNFWPDNLTNTELPTAPLVVLKRAAAELGQLTKNLLEGRVVSQRIVDDDLKPAGVSHSFYVVAPTLDNYTVQLFEARHGDLLYPVSLSGSPIRSMGLKYKSAKDEAELTELVRKLLGSEHVRKVVAGLLAQVNA